MVYSARDELTIIRLENNDVSVSIEELKKVLVERPSNTIYCEISGKLAGIISTGDVLRTYKSGLEQVQVNKKFVFLYKRQGGGKARYIFREQENINAIPIVTEDHFLVGDYTRWDDLQILDYEMDIVEKGTCNLYERQHIMLVRPAQGFSKRQRIFERFKKLLRIQNAKVNIVDSLEVCKNVDANDLVLYVDENEIRAGTTITKILSGKNCVGNVNTYKNVLGYHYFANKQRISFFNNLCYNDVKILGLVFEKSEYYEELLKKTKERYLSFGKKPFNQWPQSAYEEFFDDLYSEDYVDQILNIPFDCEYTAAVWKLKDYQSRYYNVTNGERYTDDQPEIFERSIYFFGPCYIYGLCVEDKNTVESYLQRRYCNNGEAVRVVNCGSYGMHIGYEYFSRIVVTQLKKGDIVVISQPQIVMDDIDYLDLNSVLEKNHVGAEWLINESRHCNHKVNELYAEAIYESLEPFVLEKTVNLGEIIEKDDNFIRFLYLDRYFSNFEFLSYKKIGSIVMNCNPFTFGHRYLIESALDKVDFLIIFVVEEDKSIFSFAERFNMVQEGTADMTHVMVVPSGPFILSQISFPEYFFKETSKEIIHHTEQDVLTFAEKIAPQLGIKYRFVGEEPEDKVTDLYNQAMKKILPQYGINLFEIPRKKQNGKYISASLVRKYLEENNKELLRELLPETTMKIIFNDKYCEQ